MKVNWKRALWTLAAVALLVFFITRLYVWGECAWYGSQTNREVRYAPFIGCMIHVNNDQWIPRNEVRVVQ